MQHPLVAMAASEQPGAGWAYRGAGEVPFAPTNMRDGLGGISTSPLDR